MLRCHLFAVNPEPDRIHAHLASDRRLRELPLPDELARQLPVERRNKKMRHEDWVLVALASQTQEWIESAYSVSSQWIHHSSAHLLTTYRIDNQLKLTGRVPVDVDQFSEDFLASMVDVMGTASRSIVRYIDAWATEKAVRAAGESS